MSPRLGTAADAEEVSLSSSGRLVSVSLYYIRQIYIGLALPIALLKKKI